MSNREHPFVPFPGTDAECFIQWKGTDVCIDVYCACSPKEPRHVDGYFAHFVKCPDCGTIYELGTQVKLQKVAGEPRMEPRILGDDGDGVNGSAKSEVKWMAAHE